MIGKILSSFAGQAVPIKALVYAGIFSLVMATAWTVYNKIWTSGYNTAQVELQSESIKAANAAVKKAKAEWEASAAAAEAQILVEEKIVEKIRVIEKEIPAVVESIAPECRDLGPEFLGMFNGFIDAAGNQRDDTEPTP